MTLEEVIKDLPFDAGGSTCHGREEFLAAMDKHLSIVAVKAETIGEEELTDAVDVFRKHFRGWINGTLTAEQKALMDDAEASIKKYTDRIRFPNEDDDDLAKVLPK